MVTHIRRQLSRFAAVGLVCVASFFPVDASAVSFIKIFANKLQELQCLKELKKQQLTCYDTDGNDTKTFGMTCRLDSDTGDYKFEVDYCKAGAVWEQTCQVVGRDGGRFFPTPTVCPYQCAQGKCVDAPSPTPPPPPPSTCEDLNLPWDSSSNAGIKYSINGLPPASTPEKCLSDPDVQNLLGSYPAFANQTDTTVLDMQCKDVDGNGTMDAPADLPKAEPCPEGQVCEDGKCHDGPSPPPLAALPPSVLAKALDASNQHTCAVSTNGQVWCWGRNQFGELGNGEAELLCSYSKDTKMLNCQWTNLQANFDKLVPSPVKGITTATEVAVGNGSTCALLQNGTVHCWGSGTDGELGNGILADQTIPVQAAGLVGGLSISAGGDTACAVIKGSSVHCWGRYVGGQYETPTLVPGLEEVKILSASIGKWTWFPRMVFVSQSGTAYQWGEGIPTCSAASIFLNPTAIGLVSTTPVTAAAVGSMHTCLLMADGTVACGGDNSSGQLGNGNTQCSKEAFAKVDTLANVKQVVAGAFHTCVLVGDGTVQCWGGNTYGQIGNGTTQPALKPVTVEGLSNVTQITAGASHTCALLGDGALRCWGENTNGQLGDGTTEDKFAPVPVQMFGP